MVSRERGIEVIIAGAGFCCSRAIHTTRSTVEVVQIKGDTSTHTFPVRPYNLELLEPIHLREEVLNPKYPKPNWFQGSPNCTLKRSGKKNQTYNSRKNLRKNRHK